MTVAAAINAEGLKRDEAHERWTLTSLTGPGVLLVTVILILPVAWLFWLSLFDAEGHLSSINYARLLEPVYIRTFWLTVEISAIVTVSVLVLGFPLSYLLSQLPPRIAAVCLVFVVVPFWTSVLVRTYAWLVLLQRQGLINGWLLKLGIIDAPLQLVHNMTGTVIGMTHVLLPYLVLPLYASMKTIDRDYLKAAANCGAPPLLAFWQVFFPLCLPGLLAGLTLVFVLCLGFYVTPSLLGGGRISMWSMQIENNISLYANWGAASSLGVVLLIVTLGTLYLLNRAFGIKRIYGAR